MTRTDKLRAGGAILACAAIACAVAVFAGGDLAGAALRALALVALLTGGALALHRRRGRGPVAAPVLEISERHFVAKDVGVALMTVDGRRLLVGYAPAGVALVAELGPTPQRKGTP